MTRFAAIASLAVLLVLLPSWDANGRTWTDQTGRQVEAEFIDFEDGKVRIRRQSDGKTFRVPLEQLSDSDQKYVKSQTDGSGPEQGPTTDPDESAAIVVTPDDPVLAEKIEASTPLSPSPKTIEAGGKTIKAELCTIVGKHFFDKNAMSVFRAVEVFGDRLMVIGTNHQIHSFTIGDDGLTLTIDRSFGDGGKLHVDDHDRVATLARGASGRLLASGFRDTFVIKDGKKEFNSATRGPVAMHPSGAWGIVSHGNRVSRFELANGQCKVEKMTLSSPHQPDGEKPVFELITTATVIEDCILIGGQVRLAEGDRKTVGQVGVFDIEGRERHRFGNPVDPTAEDGFGWVHAVDSCSAGMCVVDSNLRRLTLWSDDGRLLAMIRVGQLLDVMYPWLPDFTVAADGTVYFVVGQAREGNEVAEGLIYRVTGL